MKKNPNTLIVYKRFLLLFWLEVDRYRYLLCDDTMEILRKYRDIYKNKYGKENLKIVHQWDEDIYNKW